MDSEWLECKTTDIAAQIKNAIVGGPFGSNLVSKDYMPFGVPVIRGQNMGQGRWVSGEFVFVSDEKAKALSQNKARPGDIVFTQRGTLGQVSIVPDSPFDEYIVSQSQMKLTVDPEKASNLFVYYFFASPLQQDYILQNAIQTGVPHTNLDHLKKTPILLPPLKEQKAIAAILSALDDKIELNRRMNETLEAMAKALFKSWFMDFDPVRAKAEGRHPDGLAPEIAALFPDGFEESELDEIPKGWEVKRIDDVLELAYGKALKASDRIDGPIPVYGSGGITGYHNEALIEDPTVIVGRKGTVGSLYWEDDPCFPIDTVFYVKPFYPLSFCFYLLQTLGLESMNTDAAVPGLNRNNVYRLTFASPSEGLLKIFNEIGISLRQKMQATQIENDSLIKIRDSLLPKLMSGEIRVQEAEHMVESV